jgi:hypothetical protein
LPALLVSLVPPPVVWANTPPAIPNVITVASTAIDAFLAAGRRCLVIGPVKEPVKEPVKDPAFAQMFASVIASIAALVVLVIVINSL